MNNINIIKELFYLNRVLVGDDAELAIKIVSKYIPLKIIKIPSGTKCFTWRIPDKWQIKKATLKDITRNKTIVDIKKNPLNVFVGSLPHDEVVTYKVLDKHLVFRKDIPHAVPYVYKYYEKDWGFSLSYNQYKKLSKDSKYRVTIDTKYSKGNLIIGEAIIKGRTKKEIVLVAHTDHPYQANDNLSGVAVAISLANKLGKLKLKHTIKILFLPETIGSIAYVWKNQKYMKNVSAMLALDGVGNRGRILIQKSFDNTHFSNYLFETIMNKCKSEYEIVDYRMVSGSDELVYSDPKFNIPSFMVTSLPHREYHTDLDTPEIIDNEKMLQIEDIVLNWIRMYDRNIVTKRRWTGPLMRSQIGWFLGNKLKDRHLEMFTYMLDGKKSVYDIARDLRMDPELAITFAEDLLKKKLLRVVSNPQK
jgi:aminopeptidase-like protein